MTPKSSLAPLSSSVPAKSLDTFRPASIKADIRPHSDQEDKRQAAIGAVIWDVLYKHYGSYKAIEAELGKDPSFLKRDLISGRLRLEHLNALGLDMMAKIATALSDTYGGPIDPVQRLFKAIREAEDALAEIRQAAEGLVIR